MVEGPGAARIPLLGSYVAKQCPVRAQNDHDAALADLDVEEPSPAQQERMDGGNTFERRIFDFMLGALGERCLEIPDGPPGDMQAATLAAMAAGREVILGGWLPSDEEARRTGRPDILVRAAARASTAYLPVDVKHHKFTQAGPGSMAVSTLSRPFLWAAGLTDRVTCRPDRRFQDGLQLAHYWRMLEACGFAPDRRPVGAIVDSSESVWWLNLDDDVLQWPGGGDDDVVSLLGWYDRAFAERVAVVARTLARNEDPSLPRAVAPWHHEECGLCPWRQVCRTELESVDDVSLVPRLGSADRARLAAHGITTVAGLAALDWDTARLVRDLAATSLSIDGLRAATLGADPSAPLHSVVGARRPAVLRALDGAGAVTVADLDRLDPVTEALASAQSGLCDQIDQARVLWSGVPHRARGQGHLEVPRGDVEVDVDMESTAAGAYLWGALTTLRAPVPGVEEGYRPFATFDPLSDLEAGKVFREFWQWLTDLRRQAAQAGRTVRVYCYSRAAEEGQMRRALASGVRGLPPTGELESFLVSEEWVDLLATVRPRLVTCGGFGLKELAASAGFSYRDQSPSGDESMVWYRRAVSDDPEDDPAGHRRRLLAYNEDDVRATLAVREWLDRDGDRLPALEDWTAPA